MIEYHALWASTPEALNRQVNALLEHDEGWIPLGPPAIAIDSSEQETYLLQAFTRHKQ